jgi:hypothetical protein
VPTKIFLSLHPYFIRNKYVPHTINSRTPQRTNGAPRGRPTVWEPLHWSLAVSYMFPKIYVSMLYLNCETGSSGSIVSGYGLDDWVIDVLFPADARDSYLTSVSILPPGPTQLPVQWVLGVLSPALKSGRDVRLTTRPRLVPKSRMCRSYNSSSPKRLRGV